jgi:hypothetical protein
METQWKIKHSGTAAGNQRHVPSINRVAVACGATLTERHHAGLTWMNSFAVPPLSMNAHSRGLAWIQFNPHNPGALGRGCIEAGLQMYDIID